MSDSIYSPLPPSVAAAAPANALKSARDLVMSHLPESDRKEIDDGMKKTVVLGKQRDNRPKGLKKKRQPSGRRKKAGKYLTARERRDLGLFRLPRKGMRYADMAELHGLWLGYMRELLNLPQYRPGDEQTQMRLCRADLHGGLVKVVSAACPSHVGLEGYVVMETRNTLRLLSADDRLRTVAKEGAAFAVAVDGFLLTLSGSAMRMKLSERAVKKWKVRTPLDF